MRIHLGGRNSLASCLLKYVRWKAAWNSMHDALRIARGTVNASGMPELFICEERIARFVSQRHRLDSARGLAVPVRYRENRSLIRFTAWRALVSTLFHTLLDNFWTLVYTTSASPVF